MTNQSTRFTAVMLYDNVRCTVMVLSPFVSLTTKFGVTILQIEDKPWRKRDFQKNEFFLMRKENREEVRVNYLY